MFPMSRELVDGHLFPPTVKSEFVSITARAYVNTEFFFHNRMNISVMEI